jgi:catechol 2,3-dioxygenase-like lactoylglutathione lyase family enzyme
VLSHVTLGTNDFDRAVAFYDRVLAPLGITRHETDLAHGLAGYFTAPEASPSFWVMRPLDGNAAAVGNGVTVAFEAPDRATVDMVHQAMLDAGATNEGAPGLRPHYHADYYGAYARDLDGNKICCVCHRPPA